MEPEREFLNLTWNFIRIKSGKKIICVHKRFRKAIFITEGDYRLLSPYLSVCPLGLIYDVAYLT